MSDKISELAKAWQVAQQHLDDCRKRHADARAEENSASCAVSNAKVAEEKAWAELMSVRGGSGKREG